MKVFLSWSGEYSRNVATAFADWMPCVLQQVDIFMSSNAIEAGDRWDDIISEALNKIDFGILFVTDENKEKPWLLFEAGALAKNIARSKVVPVLIDTKEIDFTGSPLLKFQYQKFSKDGVFATMRSIYSDIENPIIDRATLSRCLEKWWPDLEDAFNAIEPPKKAKPKPKLSEDERLERIEAALNNVIGNVTRSNRISTQPSSTFTPNGEGLVRMLEETAANSGVGGVQSVLKGFDEDELDLIQDALQYAKRLKNLKFRPMLIDLLQDKSYDLQVPF